MSLQNIELTEGVTAPAVTLFSWEADHTPVTDRPGTFLMIDKDMLEFDQEHYQRPLNKLRAEKYGREWSWIACGTITVVMRPDRMLVVIDGQHRVVGARSRDDITELPCLVFEFEDIKDEATAFLVINTQRRGVGTLQRLPAYLTTEDPIMVETVELIRAAGREPSDKAGPRTAKCVSVISEALRSDAPALRRIWPLITEISKGRILHQDIILGLHYLEKNAPDGTSLTDPYWSRRVLKAGYEDLHASMRRAVEFHGKRGDRTLGIGALACLHYRLAADRRFMELAG